MKETERIEMARKVWQNRNHPLFVDSLAELEADRKRGAAYDWYDNWHIDKVCHVVNLSQLEDSILRVVDSNRGLVIGDLMR